METQLARYSFSNLAFTVLGRPIHPDLIDRVPDKLWNEIRDIVQETGIKTIPIEKKCKKAIWLSGGGLGNSCEKKRSEKQRRKGKI